MVIWHSHGKWPIYRLFSQLETSIYNGVSMAMLNNQMVDQPISTNDSSQNGVSCSRHYFTTWGFSLAVSLIFLCRRFHCQGQRMLPSATILDPLESPPTLGAQLHFSLQNWIAADSDDRSWNCRKRIASWQLECRLAHWCWTWGRKRSRA